MNLQQTASEFSHHKFKIHRILLFTQVILNRLQVICLKLLANSNKSNNSFFFSEMSLQTVLFFFAIAIAQPAAADDDFFKAGAAAGLLVVLAILIGFGLLFCCFRCIGWMCGCNQAQNVTVVSGPSNFP